MRVVILALVLAACGKSTPDCAVAISGAVDRIVADARPKMTPAAAANIERITAQMKQSITEACVKDKWAPAVVACLDRARSVHELSECDKQLTPAQRAEEHKRQDELLKAAVQPLDTAR